MMRKYHRWLAILFGIFMLWIAGTGVLSQVVPIVQRGGFAEERREGVPGVPPAGAATPAAIPGAPAGFTCPATMTCRPKPPAGGGASIVGTLHHLHSGESFGPLGTIVGTMSGLSLLFFTVSGLWMYLQMFRARAGNRARRAERGVDPAAADAKWFW